MKNIERPEVNDVFFELLIGVGDRNRAILELKKLGLKEGIVSNYDLWKWLEEECEPHKWEPWELEAMAHTGKTYFVLKRVNGKCELSADDYEYNHVPSDINYPTIKDGEQINIDAELERNGMKRE